MIRKKEGRKAYTPRLSFRWGPHPTPHPPPPQTTHQVIEPHWHALHEALRCPREKGVEHIDDVIRLHQEFQDTCE